MGYSGTGLGLGKAIVWILVIGAILGALAVVGVTDSDLFNFKRGGAEAQRIEAETQIAIQAAEQEQRRQAAETDALIQETSARAQQTAALIAAETNNALAQKEADRQAALFRQQEQLRIEQEQANIRLRFDEAWQMALLFLRLLAGTAIIVAGTTVTIKVTFKIVEQVPATPTRAKARAPLPSPEARRNQPCRPAPDPYADPAFRQWRIAQARRQEELTRQARQPSPPQLAPVNGHYPAPRPAVVAEKTITILNITDAMLPYPYPYTNGNGHATNGHATNGHSAAPYVNGGPYMN